ncbi:MAG TPA: hypothetical protein VK601_05070, partial [Kofleriaceae bacterium]|nr:hypothetical protein [Kofleriaceae bacterium]
MSGEIKIPFYGKWSMTVVGKNADFLQRVLIEESLASDGAVPGVVGQSVAEIDGERWLVLVESSGTNGATWQASRIKRVPGVISPNGLIVTIYSDDVVPGGSDGDFDDLILQFTYLNPEVNPPGATPYPFTLPVDSFRP